MAIHDEYQDAIQEGAVVVPPYDASKAGSLTTVDLVPLLAPLNQVFHVES